MLRRTLVLVVLSILCGCGGCGSKKSDPEQASKAAALPDAFEDLTMQYDLVAHAHLADVDFQGLFIDFGTPASDKYISGGWKTGWGTNGAEGTTTFTNVSATGRIYFPMASAAPVTLRFRVKAIGSQMMSLYMNGKTLPTVRLDGGATWKEYDAVVPAEMLEAGENQLLLRFGGSTKVGNEDVSAAVDSLRIVQTATAVPSAYQAPFYRELVGNATVDGVARRSVLVRGGTTLSYYAEIPATGKLAVSVGAEGTAKPSGVAAKVSVTPDGGPSTDVFSSPVENEWNDQAVDLARWAGQVVRLDFSVTGAATARVAWSSLGVMLPRAENEPPSGKARNVVVLLIDTMRADKLKPFNPRTRVRTPVLDQVATDGAVFSKAHSPENWTKPSVASVLTSLWPATHGTKQDPSVLPEQAVMLSEVFKQSGFSTATVLANGYVSDRFGFDQGWDHYTNFIRDNKPTGAEYVFKAAGDWIEQNKDKRFFVYIQTIDPHVPYDPPAEFLSMYDSQPYEGIVQPRQTASQLEQAKRNPPTVTFTDRDRQRLAALYDGEVSYHDRELGKFIDRLKQLGLWENTLFVITADHGEEFYDHQSYGHGHTLYEELLHVPLIFRFPAGIPKGTRIDSVATTVDIGPTLMDAVGLPAPPTFEGQTLWGTMRGQPRPGPMVAFSDFLDDRRAITGSHYKLILKGINAEYYDLARDPHEQNKLDSSRMPVASRYLRMLIGQFLGATNRAKWLEAEQGRPVNRFGAQTTNVDQEMRQQIRALGYAN